MEKVLEISVAEVSEIIGISKEQLNKNFKRYIPKLKKYGIMYEGKGKNRKFYKLQKDVTNEYLAYEMFEQIAYNVWGFNRQTSIEKLLHYICITLYLQETKSKDSFLIQEDIAKTINVNKKTLSKYKKILVDNQVLYPKNLEPYITITSYYKKEFPSWKSRLIPNVNNRLNKIDQPAEADNFKYGYELSIDGVFKQEEDNKVIVSNDIWETYLNSNNSFVDFNNSFVDFKYQLGIKELYIIRKSKFINSFMEDEILLDIIYKAFKYKFPGEEKIIKFLEKYNITYLEEIEVNKKVS